MLHSMQQRVDTLAVAEIFSKENKLSIIIGWEMSQIFYHSCHVRGAPWIFDGGGGGGGWGRNGLAFHSEMNIFFQDN